MYHVILFLLFFFFYLGSVFGSGIILSSSPHVSNLMLFESSAWLLMKVPPENEPKHTLRTMKKDTAKT